MAMSDALAGGVGDERRVVKVEIRGVDSSPGLCCPQSEVVRSKI